MFLIMGIAFCTTLHPAGLLIQFSLTFIGGAVWYTFTYVSEALTAPIFRTDE
jgi:hypothetical protein